MKAIIDSVIKNKDVLILGFGREGKSTLTKLLAVDSAYSITVADTRDIADELPDGVSSICGDHYMDLIDDYDVVFKSPGIVLPKEASSYKCLITSETEIFIQKYRNQIIGITGTKGKSTTSALIYHILKESGKEVLFGGNIGIPVFDISEYINDNTVIVLELSCHQLEYAITSPKYAVLLNIFEDHLDHYGTREKYAHAKMNIYLNQIKDDVLFTTKETVSKTDGIKSAVEYVSLNDSPIKSFDELENVKLRGTHNLLNVAFAYDICKKFDVADDVFINAVDSFEPLPHRLQLVYSENGVDYYDDSISTTVQSCISAIKSVQNSKILLMGGMERNLEYSELVDFLAKSNLDYVVCMYESGKRFYEMYRSFTENLDVNCKAVFKADLESAVAFSKLNAKEDSAVLLSPAAASYDHFKNFEERGEAFTNLVKNK